MKCLGVDGREYIINIQKLKKNTTKFSQLHLTARDVFKKKFPYSSIYEEVLLPSTKLVADFFIPDLQIIAEVHGAQHYRFIKHFHKTKTEFKIAKARDQTKKYWCEINNWIFIELPYNEIENWSVIINDAIS